ncbi:MAG: hypothetical protein AAGA34_08725 [Pseudomonadota bacterium]
MRWVSLVALIGALAACSGEAEPAQTQTPNEQGGQVSGEVLGGTISDAMIPLESLQSQSPPAARAAPSQPNEEEVSALSAPEAPVSPSPAAPIGESPAANEEGAASPDAAPPQ